MLLKKPNLSIATNAGVGKTLVAGVAIFKQINQCLNHTQAIYVVDSYESAQQMFVYFGKLFAFTDIKIGLAVRLEESFVTHFDCHVLIGTPNEVASFRMLNVFNMKKLSIIILDDADSVISSTYTKNHLINAIDPKCQTLIMSSSWMSHHETNHVPNIHRCELFVDKQPFPANIEHFFIECLDEETKHKMLHTLCSMNGKMPVMSFSCK